MTWTAVMLWLCIVFPRLPFDALSLDDATLQVVTFQHKRTRLIAAASRAAEKLNFQHGMDYAKAAALCSELKAIERNPRAERNALNRLAAWAYQWSSFVTLRAAASDSCDEHSLLWLEIAASFKLFGGRAALLQRIERELAALGYDYRLGVGCSLEGAALLARIGKRVVASTPASLRRQIEKLPIASLALDRAVLFELERAGIRTVQTFIELPKDAIARRFGPKVNDYLDRLLGIAPDPRPLFQLPKKYRARCELGAETHSVEALLFPLRRMLGELQGYLRAIDAGLQRFTLLLKHREGTTRVVIGFSTPERRAEQFFAIVRERFERLELPAPVLEIGVHADRFTDPAVKQVGLFADAQHADNFQHVLDKLNARLGDDAVRYCRPMADHRPEKAWRLSAAPSPTTHSVASPRPLWLIAEPRRISPPRQPLERAERIEAGWWDGADAARDYYKLSGANGARYWVYRDLTNGEWFLHGLWS